MENEKKKGKLKFIIPVIIIIVIAIILIIFLVIKKNDNNTEETISSTQENVIYNSVGDTVETDILKFTLDSAEFAIALDNTYTALIKGWASENYGTPKEYNEETDKANYLVASKGHTLVAITLTLENLDRTTVIEAVKGINIIYNDITYSEKFYSLTYSNDGENWHFFSYSASSGSPSLTMHEIGINSGITKKCRIYIDIPVEVDNLNDNFQIDIKLKTSSEDSYKQFYYDVSN